MNVLAQKNICMKIPGLETNSQGIKCHLKARGFTWLHPDRPQGRCSSPSPMVPPDITRATEGGIKLRYASPHSHAHTYDYLGIFLSISWTVF